MQSQSVRGTVGVSFALVVLALGLEGCTTFSPQIKIPQRKATLQEADAQIQSAIEDLQKGQKERYMFNAATGVGTLIGVAGAALSPVFKGTRDLTVGLAAFGAGNYTVGSIYGGKLVPAVYASGIDALLCVSNLEGPLKDSFEQVHRLGHTLHEAQSALVTRLEQLGCTDSGEPRYSGKCSIPTTQFDAAQAAYGVGERTLQATSIRIAGEAQIAGQVSDAVRGIVNEVNKQVQAALPDAAAIQRLAAGISTTALAAPTTINSGGSPTPPALPLRAPTPDTQLNLSMDEVKTASTSLSAALTPVPTLHTDTCKVADQPATAPMATDAPAIVNLTVNSAIQNYKITGGNGAYNPHWIGEEPAELLAAMQADTLKILVKPGTKPADFGGKTYQLDVYDSEAGTPKHLPAPITVNTQK